MVALWSVLSQVDVYESSRRLHGDARETLAFSKSKHGPCRYKNSFQGCVSSKTTVSSASTFSQPVLARDFFYSRRLFRRAFEVSGASAQSVPSGASVSRRDLVCFALGRNDLCVPIFTHVGHGWQPRRHVYPSH